MSRRFRLSDANQIRVSPNRAVVSDLYQIAPIRMWSMTSRPARELMAFAEQHPRIECIFRYWTGCETKRPSLLYSKLKELDAEQRIAAGVAEFISRDAFTSPIPMHDAYRLHGESDVYVNREWADIWLAHGCVPYTGSTFSAVRWCDKSGKRVGYQMPLRPPSERQVTA